MRKFVVTTSMILLSLLPGTALGERYAIVVGVNDCPDFRLPDGSKPRPLRGAENDANAVAEVLRTRFGFDPKHIYLLKGREATREKLEARFEQLARLAKQNDVIVFHFSGHGTQFDDRRPFDEPDRLDEALCMYDATADGKHLVVDDELGVWLDDIPARHVTVILDCCHAGTGIKDPDDEIRPRFLPIESAAKPASAGKDVWTELRGSTKAIGRKMTAFFACRPEQQAYERRFFTAKAPLRAGQFSYYLLEGLRDARADANRDGTLSTRELLDFTTGRLQKTFNSKRKEPAARQEPLLETDSGDEPVFGLKLPKSEDTGRK